MQRKVSPSYITRSRQSIRASAPAPRVLHGPSLAFNLRFFTCMGTVSTVDGGRVGFFYSVVGYHESQQ